MTERADGLSPIPVLMQHVNSLMFINKSIVALVRKGRYQLRTPEGQSPAIITIFYLDGDILVYADENILAGNEEVHKEHFKKLDVFLGQIKRQLQTLETVATTSLFLLSLIGLVWADIDQYIALAVSTFVGTIAWYGRKLLGRGLIKLVYTGYFKMGKRIVFNKDLFSRRKVDG